MLSNEIDTPMMVEETKMRGIPVITKDSLLHMNQYYIYPKLLRVSKQY